MMESGGMDRKNLGDSVPTHRAHPKDRSGADPHFAVPIGSATRGRLRFTGGAHWLVVRAELHLPDLCQVRFGDRMPTMGARRGVVSVRYPRFPTDDWLSYQSERPAHLTLNASLPWDVEVRGGVSQLVAELRALRLGSLLLEGGASRLEVMLPSPSGTVAVLILGGASNVTIYRPAGVSARLRVEGGATNLTFDGRHTGAAGGELDLRTSNHDGATDRYEFAITGGANNVSIEGDERSEP
jgi:hypothetical protein